MYLNCKTYFSFKYGTFSTRELVDAGIAEGVSALALTNINNTCDVWDFVQYCRDAGIKPIVGCELRDGDRLVCILLAANDRGLLQLHQYLSACLEGQRSFDTDYTTVYFERPEDGFVLYPLGTKPPTQLAVNERIGIQPSELPKLFGQDMTVLRDKLVIRQPVTVQNKLYFNLHRLLRAMDKNCVATLLPPATVCRPDETFVSPGTLLQQFQQYPFIVTNTYALVDACLLTIRAEGDKNKQCFSASKADDRILLEKLAQDGFRRRYGPQNAEAKVRLAKELRIIDEMGFNAYFLINWDIIRYAQSRGFYYVGRGSGANSIVAYCLHITDVDPIELNLYFERFLNPHRTSPPDFDIDFSWTDRDEVMDYVFKRYGRQHVALLGAYPTFQGRSIIRELGKVFGLPDEEIKRLQSSRKAEDNIQALILRYGKLLENMPSHPSLHPCGMLITEAPIRQYLASFMPPKGFATGLMDMFVAENMGINKFDILSQRGLGHIRTSLEIIERNHGVRVDIHDILRFKKDERIKAEIREARTIGCFYIESPAMRQLLKKLRCDDYLTLVAASSIIRPGVAQSGMMREYIERYHHREQVKYLHPLFEEHLSETFGVMVYQEDVIKIAHYFAGLDLGEADVLRRAMSGKYRSDNQFNLVREKFFAKAHEMGHPPALVTEVWRQMVSFAGYSFNKAHSASFAVESYMSLYLKTYYPKEFMVAVINNFGGFYSTELYFMELLKTGGNLQAPCINTSEKLTLIYGDKVYPGFIHIRDLQDKLIDTILTERQGNGPYLHLQDFIERTQVGKQQLNTLISAGCFGFTGLSKKRLLWEGNFMANHVTTKSKSVPLFATAPASFDLPELSDRPLDDLHDQLESLGFPLCNPFALVDDDPNLYIPARQLSQQVGKKIKMLLYFIAYKVVPTVKQEQMSFGTFLDADLDWVDTVHFPDSFRKYPITKNGFYRATGKVVSDFGVCSLEVQVMEKVGYKVTRYAGL